MNVRSFDPDKFYVPEEKSVMLRAIWYYCPQALTEFKLSFLDVAKRMNILDEMQTTPPSPYGGTAIYRRHSFDSQLGRTKRISPLSKQPEFPGDKLKKAEF